MTPAWKPFFSHYDVRDANFYCMLKFHLYKSASTTYLRQHDSTRKDNFHNCLRLLSATLATPATLPTHATLATLAALATRTATLATFAALATLVTLATLATLATPATIATCATLATHATLARKG